MKKKNIAKDPRKIEADVFGYESSEATTKKDVLAWAENFLDSDSVSAQVTKGILALVAVGGVVCVGAVAPGIVKAVRSLQTLSKKEERSVQSTFYRLKKNGLVQIKQSPNGKIKVFLSPEGYRHLRIYASQGMAPKKKMIWDRRWRVLIFDIPSEKSMIRDAFRNTIKGFGFYQMQKSVWVYPYPCEDEILFLAKRYGIADNVEILTVKKMVHDLEMRKIFGF